MKNAKIASMLISVSTTILVFTGCGSNAKAPMVKSPIISKTQVVTKTPNTTKTNQSISTATVKTLFSKTLKGLVTTKTITQTQSSKVFAVITKNMSQVSRTTNNSTKTTPNTGTTPGTGTNMTPNTGAYGGTSKGAGTNMTPNTGTSSGGAGTGTGTTNSTNQTEMTNYSTNIINGLNSLVKSRVITQKQASTIHQKIQAELTNLQNKK
jgi:hypothetical protein